MFALLCKLGLHLRREWETTEYDPWVTGSPSIIRVCSTCGKEV